MDQFIFPAVFLKKGLFMGKLFAFLLFLILFLMFLGRPTEALSFDSPTQADQATQAVIDKYRSLIPQLMQKQRIPVMAIAIVDDAQRRRTTTGTAEEYFRYGVKTWGRTLELHKVRLSKGTLTLDGDPLSKIQPGLFFLENGEVLDLRGPVFYYRNTRLDKIGQGTVIFYTLFIPFCALVCLAALVWPPIRWIWRKIRGTASAVRPAWPGRVSRIFILLAALVGLVLFAGLVKYPSLVLDGPWFPTPSSPSYVSFFLLSPYILLALTLVAAVFTWLGWKGRKDRDRWIDLGTIALLAAYALVVI